MVPATSFHLDLVASGSDWARELERRCDPEVGENREQVKERRQGGRYVPADRNVRTERMAPAPGEYTEVCLVVFKPYNFFIVIAFVLFLCRV